MVDVVVVTKVCEGVSCPLQRGRGSPTTHRFFNRTRPPYALIATTTIEKILRQVERGREGSSLCRSCLEVVRLLKNSLVPLSSPVLGAESPFSGVLTLLWKTIYRFGSEFFNRL